MECHPVISASVVLLGEITLAVSTCSSYPPELLQQLVLYINFF